MGGAVSEVKDGCIDQSTDVGTGTSGTVAVWDLVSSRKRVRALVKRVRCDECVHACVRGGDALWEQ